MQKLRKGMSFMVNRRVALAMALWRERVSAVGSDDPMSRAIRHLVNRGLSRGWVAWHASWSDGLRKRNSMRQSLGHLLNRQLSRGWGAWVEMAVEHALFMQKLRKGMGHMLNRRLSASFVRWVRSSVNARTAAVAEWSPEQHLVFAWSSWLRYLIGRARLQLALSSALASTAHRRTRRALIIWRTGSRSGDDPFGRAARHLARRQMSRGWLGWVSEWSRLAHKRDTMRRSLTHLLNRGLSRGWAGWHAAWSAAVRKRDSMRRSLSHLLNRELSRGWGAWVEMVVERMVFMQKLRKGMSFMVNRRLATGFAIWRGHPIGVDPATRALRHLVNRQLSRGWVGWHASWSELVRKRNSMRQSLSHLLNRQLSRGWGAWVEMAVERATFLQKLRRGLAFALHRKLALGFASWCVGAMVGGDRSVAASDALIMRAVRHALHRLLSRAWAKMLATTTFTLRGRGLEHHSEQADAQRRLRRAFDKLAMRADLGRLHAVALDRIRSVNDGRLRAVWELWMERVVDEVRSLQRKRRALSHMVNRRLARSFRHFVALAGERSAVRQLGVKAAHHLYRGPAARCWRTWLAAVATDSRHQRLLRKSASYFYVRGLARSLASWRAMHEDVARAMYLLRKGTSYMRHRQRVGALLRWKSGFARAPESTLATRAMRHLLSQQLSKGWRGWELCVAERAAAWRLMRKSVAFMRHRELSRALASWQARTSRESLDHVVKSDRFALATAVKRWRRGPRARNLASRAMLHAMHRELARGWQAWRSRKALSDEVLMRRAVGFFVSGEMARSFQRWRANQQEMEAAMHLTFASAAAILPIASTVPPVPKSPPKSPQSPVMTGAAPSAGMVTPTPKKMTPSRKPASRPRMVFH